MELVEIFAEILKYIVPATLVLVGMRFVMQSQDKRQQQVFQSEIRAEVLKQHLPLKFAAYERAILFLERISPEQLLTRILAADKPAEYYRLELVQAIREEFEHNLAQQLYIEAASWQALVQAKDEVITLVHHVASSLEKESEGRLLARKILESVQTQESGRIQTAIILLKRDIQSWFQVNPS